MWMIRYLLCRMRDHAYASVTCQGTDSHRHYLYCLRCGKVAGDGEDLPGHLAA